jgi:hypothetical protein
MLPLVVPIQHMGKGRIRNKFFDHIRLEEKGNR